MRVSYLASLPAGYRFTEEDSDKNWEILGKYFMDPEFEMTPEEYDFTAVLDMAERLKREFGFWPTKETVIERIEKQREEEIEKDRKQREWHLKNAAPDKS